MARFKIEIPLLVAASLCIGPLGQAQGKITYQDHIHPLFENTCNSCHNADKDGRAAGEEITAAAQAYSAASTVALKKTAYTTTTM